MDSLAVIYYWARVGIVGLIALLALVFALRRSKPKPALLDLLAGALNVAGLAAVVVLAQPPLNLIVAAIALALGVTFGFALGSIRPLAAWLGAGLIVFATIMVLFGEGGAVAAGLTGLAFAGGVPLGQGIRSTRKTAPPVKREAVPEPT